MKKLLNRFQKSLLVGFLLFLFGTNGFAQVNKNTIVKFSIKNEETGFSVANASIKVIYPNGSTKILETKENGKVDFPIDKNKYVFLISASGYDPIETHFSGSSDIETINAEINLDSNAIRTVKKTVAEEKQTNNIILRGYISDENTGSPLSNSIVKALNYTARTNNEGFFELSFPVAPLEQDKTPAKISIEITKQGYRTHIKQNFYLIPSSYTLKTSLIPSLGQNRSEKAEVIVTTEGHAIFDRTEQEEALRYSAMNAKVNNDNYQNKAAAIVIPTSIRVGTSCSCTTCENVSVMTLEAYTQSGLDDEWIPSWRANSLRAGAIAYRSYGAWNVLNSNYNNFDIASSTCNQVWRSDISADAKDAAIATAGMVLVKNGAIYRAEYSSENNNSGCGNGYAGTGTANGWPCISDSRCAGRASFGHGRGMCQYGSQFWSSDKNYLWIIDHYYTPGGVSLYSSACPASLTFTSTISAGNYKTSGNITASASVANGATVTFNANGDVFLNAGFFVSSALSGDFTASPTGGCSARNTDLQGDENLVNTKLSEDNMFTLYPNPSAGKLNLDYKVSNEKILSIGIVDMSGKEVKSLTSGVSSSNDMGTIVIDDINLPKGIYTVLFTSSRRTASKKLIIQ